MILLKLFVVVEVPDTSDILYVFLTINSTVLPDTSGVFEACNYVMLFLCYTLCFNSVLSYF